MDIAEESLCISFKLATNNLQPMIDIYYNTVIEQSSCTTILLQYISYNGCETIEDDYGIRRCTFNNNLITNISA